MEMNIITAFHAALIEIIGNFATVKNILDALKF